MTWTLRSLAWVCTRPRTCFHVTPRPSVWQLRLTMPQEMRSVSVLNACFFFCRTAFLILLSLFHSAGGRFERAGGDQPASEAVHGQNHSGHSRPQPLHPGDQKLNNTHTWISVIVPINQQFTVSRRVKVVIFKILLETTGDVQWASAAI